MTISIYTNSANNAFAFTKSSEIDSIGVVSDATVRFVELNIYITQTNPPTYVAGAKLELSHNGNFPIPEGDIKMLSLNPNTGVYGSATLAGNVVTFDDGIQNNMVTIVVTDPPPRLSFVFSATTFPATSGTATVSGSLRWR